MSENLRSWFGERAWPSHQEKVISVKKKRLRWRTTLPVHNDTPPSLHPGKSLELEQPKYFVDGRGTLQAKKGR